MQRSVNLVEAYLVLDQPRQRVGHWASTLTPLDDHEAPPLAAIAAYYDPQTDQALLGLRYDEVTLGNRRLSYVINIALLAEIGMIQPASLSEGDRRRFLTERLARCNIVVEHRTVLGALSELVRKIRETKARTSTLEPIVPAVIARTITRPATVPMRPASKHDSGLLVTPKGTRDNLQQQKFAKSTRDELSRMPEDRGKAIDDLEPNRMPPGIIYARYLRSGRWVPIRIGALSLKGAALMSGVLPRIDDHVDLAFAYADHRALVRGPVKKISSREEAAATGAATFSVQFELDDSSRRALTSLLTAARAAEVTIKPPPARSTRRYPVEWPVCLGTMRGAVRADALDVSTGGMFVRPAHPLKLDTTLTFSVVLDDGGAPISARAKVVRHITEDDARAAGLVAGYGLSINDMGDVDLERWMRFLSRIEQRADKRVLVGATANRLVELQAALAAIGYAVSGGTEPGALVQLAGAGRSVDAVLLDGEWLAPGTSTAWIESLFSARQVPCVTMHGDIKRGRNVIDRLLSIS
jgi:hypothetical protein